MNLQFHCDERPGWTSVLRPGSADLEFLSFGLVRLRDGERYAHPSVGEEHAVVLLSGSCRVDVAGEATIVLGARKNVFDGYASAVYVPPETPFVMLATGDVEVAICSASTDEGGPVTVIRPEDVNVRQVGKDNWTRTVTDVIGDNVGARRLIVGETYNPPGNWSSAPPHRHDHNNPPDECDMEEVYFYRFDPPQGFGIQRVYEPSMGLDETFTVQEDDAVAIPFGYHPVVAAPGYRLYYLWALAGEERALLPWDDPEHAWVKADV